MNIDKFLDSIDSMIRCGVRAESATDLDNVALWHRVYDDHRKVAREQLQELINLANAYKYPPRF
jgi:hypothetical protein